MEISIKYDALQLHLSTQWTETVKHEFASIIFIHFSSSVAAISCCIIPFSYMECPAFATETKTTKWAPPYHPKNGIHKTNIRVSFSSLGSSPIRSFASGHERWSSKAFCDGVIKTSEMAYKILLRPEINK